MDSRYHVDCKIKMCLMFEVSVIYRWLQFKILYQRMLLNHAFLVESSKLCALDLQNDYLDHLELFDWNW